MDEELRKVALQNGIDPDNPKPGTVLITPPKLSDEEEGSQFMPARHRCDGCTAIAYQVTYKSLRENESLIRQACIPLYRYINEEMKGW